MSQHEYDPNDAQQWQQPAEEQFRRIEAPRPKKKKGADSQKVVRYVIYALVALALLVTAKNVFSPNKKRAGWVTGYPPVKLTKEQTVLAVAMGKEIAEHMSSGHGEDCHAMTNWNAAMDRIERDVNADPVARTALRKIINEQWAGDSPGLFRHILKDQGRNDIRVDSDFLRMTDREGYPAALVRCSPNPNPNRVEYHEVILYPMKEEGGKLRVIDVYDCQTGIYATDRLRWAGVQETGVKSDEHGPWLAAFGKSAVGHLLTLKALISQDILRNGQAAYDSIKTLPDELRESAPIYALELCALRNAMDDPKKGLTDEMKARFLTLLNTQPTGASNKPETAPLLAEFFHKEGRQPEAEEQMTKAHAQMKDGFLKYVVSKWRLDAGDVTGAETAYTQAKAEAPHLKQLFNHGKAIEAKKAPQ